MRVGAVRWLARCAAVACTAAGCAGVSAGANAGGPGLVRGRPTFEGSPEFVAGATVWSGNGTLRPPLQIADSILAAWGWSMALAEPTGTMSTQWAYFSTGGGAGNACAADRIGAIRFVLDPEDGGRTLAVRAEAHFTAGADHERGLSFARKALSAFYEATQDAVDFRRPPRERSASPTPAPRPLSWPGFAGESITSCGQAGQAR